MIQHAIQATPAPGIKRRIVISDPVTSLANRVERTLRDTSMNARVRTEIAIALCRAAAREARGQNHEPAKD